MISADETREVRALCDRFLEREAGGVEIVATAAIRVDGEVWTLPRPARHDTVLWAWIRAHRVDDIGMHEQGFVTSRGRFVGRDEAGELALAAGQVDRAGLHLCTEDLW